MPLPVEQSQGSVQSLVARFQTAANRDAEHARRQSLPPRRLSSNTFSKKDHQAKTPEPPAPISPGPLQPSAPFQPVTDAGAKAAPLENGMKEPVVRREDEKDAGSRVGEEAPEREVGKDGNEKTTVQSMKDKSKDLVEGVKDLAIGGGSKGKKANDEMAKEDDPASSTIPKSNGSTTRGPASKAEKEVPKSSPSAPNTKQPVSTSSPIASKDKPVRSKTSVKSAHPASSTKNPAQSTSAAKAPQANLHKKEMSNESTGSTSETPAKKQHHTPRLVPSATGPARRASLPPNQSATPLRPQLTGTPSKPTASYLAKTRTPSGSGSASKPSTGSMGRAQSRMRPQSISPSPAPASRTSLAASGSRLMQGTAASRARAAEAKVNPSPTAARTGGKAKVLVSQRTGATAKGDVADGTPTKSLEARPADKGARMSTGTGQAAARRRDTTDDGSGGNASNAQEANAAPLDGAIQRAEANGEVKDEEIFHLGPGGARLGLAAAREAHRDDPKDTKTEEDVTAPPIPANIGHSLELEDGQKDLAGQDDGSHHGPAGARLGLAAAREREHLSNGDDRNQDEAATATATDQTGSIADQADGAHDGLAGARPDFEAAALGEGGEMGKAFTEEHSAPVTDVVVEDTAKVPIPVGNTPLAEDGAGFKETEHLASDEQGEEERPSKEDKEIEEIPDLA